MAKRKAKRAPLYMVPGEPVPAPLAAPTPVASSWAGYAGEPVKRKRKRSRRGAFSAPGDGLRFGLRGDEPTI
jgi:hypothetical protein